MRLIAAIESMLKSQNEGGGLTLDKTQADMLRTHLTDLKRLLEQAKKLGIRGGSAFRAIAGFGRHGVLHEEHFFELAADLTVEVEFACSDEEAEKLLALLRRERLSVFYARVPAQFGTIEGDS